MYCDVRERGQDKCHQFYWYRNPKPTDICQAVSWFESIFRFHNDKWKQRTRWNGRRHGCADGDGGYSVVPSYILLPHALHKGANKVMLVNLFTIWIPMLKASQVLGGPVQWSPLEQGQLPVQPQAGAGGRGGVREAERGQLRGQQVRILGCDWSHAATILSCDWLSRVPSTIGTPVIGGSFRNISGLPRWGGNHEHGFCYDNLHTCRDEDQVKIDIPTKFTKT